MLRLCVAETTVAERYRYLIDLYTKKVGNNMKSEPKDVLSEAEKKVIREFMLKYKPLMEKLKDK